MPDTQIPDKMLHRKYLQPILYLADRMSETDGLVVAKVRRMIESLAQAAGMPDFRHDNSYRQLSDHRACDMLDTEDAKTAALVVISLVLKTGAEHKDEEYGFFSKIRNRLNHAPVTVPVDVQEHKELALKFLTQPVAPAVVGRRPPAPQA